VYGLAAEMTHDNDVEMSALIDLRPVCPPEVLDDMNRCLLQINPMVIAALDKLTPLKFRLYSPHDLQFQPELYQRWRQALWEARTLQTRARTTMAPISSFLENSKDALYAMTQDWTDIYTKERSLRAMLKWVDSDFEKLGFLLTKYALGLIGSS